MKVKGIPKRQLYFEDVEVGTEIPSLTKLPFTQSNQAAFAGVAGGVAWCPGHFDYKFAREHFRLGAPFAYGAQVTVCLGQLMTDWIGPDGVLKKLKSNLKEVVWCGSEGERDQLTMKGKVIAKYLKDGNNYIDCEIWAENQHGAIVNPGAATVVLPSRNQKKRDQESWRSS